MTESATPRIPAESYAYLWEGVVLYASHELVNAPHAHFPAHLQISLGEPFTLTLPNGEKRQGHVAIVGPNVTHATHSDGPPLLSILIDQDAPSFRYIYPLVHDSDIVFIAPEIIAPLHRRLSRLHEGLGPLENTQHLCAELLRLLCPAPLAQLPWDKRLIQAADFLRSRLDHEPPPVSEVAKHVNLSASRLSHLFSAQFGLTLRQFHLWIRLVRAANTWRQGIRMNEMAVAAGFFDQAHFTRTMMRMMGRSPLRISHTDLKVIFEAKVKPTAAG